MDYQLTNKYLLGETSESEVKELFNWIEEAPENRKEFIAYKKVWALTARGNESEVKIWRLIFAPRLKRHKFIQLSFQLARYAAILLLVFVSGFALQYIGWAFDKEKLVYQKNTTITVPMGQMTNVELPDGTKVMLNSGSSITYNGNFALGERQVSLNGEAYFDVAKDREHPFLVQTSHLSFEVLGTSFNIEAYAEDNLVNATLIEGSLGVKEKSQKGLMLLAPGEYAHYDVLTTKISITKVNTDIYTSWKEGLITFRNEKLKDIARKIERWYNVKIIISNQKLGEQAYFGTILKNKPIDQILEVLRLSSSLKYRMITKPDVPTLIYWD
jgi:ferric-dicitrate binding protein FerR (iron transport regulator)